MADKADRTINPAPDMEETNVALYTHNFPEVCATIPSTMSAPHQQSAFRDYDALGTLGLTNRKQAAMIYYSNGPMLALDRTDHSVEVRKHLNKYGLKIFLTEPICSHMVDDQYADKLFHNFNFGFYSEFYNDGNTRKFRAKELDSIWAYVRRNALTNVTVATCDYDIHKYYPLYTEHMTLTYEDLFLKFLKVYNGMDQSPKQKITKKFVAPLWRYTTARYLIAAVMAESDAFLSWYFAVSPNMCEQSPWANKREIEKYFPGFYERYQSAALAMNRAAPYTLDMPASQATFVREHAAHNYPLYTEDEQINDGMNPVAYNEKTHQLEYLYRETFVSVHAESRFAQPTGNYSEKVIQSIIYRTPFILLAPPHTLKCMREAGYKTFDKWWDESYDEEENHVLRFKKIVEIIDWIDGLSYKVLFKMHKDMEAVLNWNFQVAVDSTQTGAMSKSDNKFTHVSWQSEWADKNFNNEK